MANTLDSRPRPAPLTGLPPRPAMAFDRRGSLPTTMPVQSMEGYLSIPPDRGTIIGKSTWKTRFVCVGSAYRDYQPPPTPATPGMPGTPASRVPSNRISTPLSRTPSQGFFLSIYKQRSDTEVLQQYPLSLISDCQLQMLSHRKQGPALPTMVITVLPDPQAEKARKRRSSRTAGFATPKDVGPTTLLFRPADEHPTLNDWVRFIQQLIQPHLPERSFTNPLTPLTPSFIDPFSLRPRELSDLSARPSSGHGSRAGFSAKSSTQTYSSRERPLTFSDAPSLRSKRSDLSSQTSMNQQQSGGFHGFPGILPADLPSPATTIGDYHGEFIEGWTVAQGRSSALSSPMRARDGSVSSQTQAQIPAVSDLAPAPAPAPRETILDRAFQLRCIPGADKEIPGEDKLSSLARFEALMKEMDEKRKQREAEEAKTKSETAAASMTSNSEPKSAFEVDSSSESDDSDSDDDSENFANEADMDDRFSSTSTQRPLDYISGRYEPVPRTPASPRVQSPRAPPIYNHEAFMALSSNEFAPAPRPQTGYAKTRSRPSMSPRTHSQPQLQPLIPSSNPLDTPRNPEAVTGFSFTPGSPSAVHRPTHEKRLSTSSSKRLSFSEFTRRLSTTSSLLAMHTNAAAAGSASRRTSYCADPDHYQAPQSPPQHLHHLHPRATQSPRSPPPMPERDRCVWRGSMGVFGAGEGGFV